jgi:hypothetical protein
MMDFGDNKQRQYQCFVCAEVFSTHKEMQEHIIQNHEESREYLICPLEHCKAVVRDIRVHFKNKHKFCKCPENCQLRATIMYDTKSRKKIPNFKKGFHVSPKALEKCLYRSNYELEVYKAIDKDGEILRYKVEPFSIPYYFNGRKRNYFPDLIVEYSSGAIEIWEIKPETQKTVAQNKAKWNAAKSYCQLRGYNFQVITESDIANLKLKKL